MSWRSWAGVRELALVSWRWGWDSNPRELLHPTGFQNQRNRPLCHPTTLCFCFGDSGYCMSRYFSPLSSAWARKLLSPLWRSILFSLRVLAKSLRSVTWSSSSTTSIPRIVSNRSSVEISPHVPPQPPRLDGPGQTPQWPSPAFANQWASHRNADRLVNFVAACIMWQSMPAYFDVFVLRFYDCVSSKTLKGIWTNINNFVHKY